MDVDVRRSARITRLMTEPSDRSRSTGCAATHRGRAAWRSRAGEVDERDDDVVGDDLVVGAAEIGEELPVAFEQVGE